MARDLTRRSVLRRANHLGRSGCSLLNSLSEKATGRPTKHCQRHLIPLWESSGSLRFRAATRTDAEEFITGEAVHSDSFRWNVGDPSFWASPSTKPADERNGVGCRAVRHQRIPPAAALSTFAPTLCEDVKKGPGRTRPRSGKGQAPKWLVRLVRRPRGIPP